MSVEPIEAPHRHHAEHVPPRIWTPGLQQHGGGAHPAKHVLLIFLDGVGIGAKDPQRNPFFSARLPFLRDALGAMPSLRNRTIEGAAAVCIPADARLGVAGLPQSGTGQTALYTGVNTARMIGRHFGPYVYSTLKPLLHTHSVFRQLVQAGVPHRDLALANAFPRRFFEYLEGPRRRMVAGMMMALAEQIPFRAIDALMQEDAVSTDITAVRWREIGHPEARTVSPREAGATLARIAHRHAFTLFEYFLTDKAGHERDHALAAATLSDVDALLHGVIEHTDASSTLVVVASDHGNIEDLSTKAHTRNPVPVLLFGDARRSIAYSIRSLSDLTPAIVRFLA